MRIETLIIIAIIVYLFFMRPKPKTVDVSPSVTQNDQLPTQQQNAQDDGGAGRALISEGIAAGKEVAMAIIHAFDNSEESAAPQTQSNTF